MIEILFTDFDSTAVILTDETDSQEGDEGEESNDVDVLNEMLSRSDKAYEKYCVINRNRIDKHLTLFTDPDDIPDFVR
jgi:hypothetical protein